MSFALDAIQCSYSSFNLQLQPLISQKTCLDSCSLGLGSIIYARAYIQYTKLYTEFITVYYNCLLIHISPLDNEL